MKILLVAIASILLSSCESSEDTPSELLIKDLSGDVHITILKDPYLREGEDYFHPTKSEILLCENLLASELKKPNRSLLKNFISLVVQILLYH